MSTSVAQRSRVTTSGSSWVLRVSLVTLVVVFAVRLVAIHEPMGPDQGVYATIAWAMRRGLLLYRDLFEVKPPGIYLTYVLGFAVFGSRETSIFWLDYTAAVLTALVIFDLGRRIVSTRFGALAALVFAVATWPAARFAVGGLFERTISEKFISLLAAAAAWATAIAVVRTRDRWSFAAGLFIGAAGVFKPFALVYWPALVLWTWLVTDGSRSRRFAVYSAAGGLIAPLAGVGWLLTQGVLGNAWVILTQFGGRLAAPGASGFGYVLDRFVHEVFRRMKTDEVWALGSIAACAALCTWRWRSTRPGWIASLGVIWLGAALAAIPMNGPRMGVTYFVPALVPLSVLIAWLFYQTLASARRAKAGLGVLLLVFAAFMVVQSGSASRAIGMTAWDARYLASAIDSQEYLQRFRSRRDPPSFSAADNARLADYIRAHTDPTDRIFVFGMTAGTYFSSERMPASRFVFVFPPAVSDTADRLGFGMNTLTRELAHARARYIVLQRNSGDSFSGWRTEDSFGAAPMTALLTGYDRETEIGTFVLYRRKS